MCLDSLMYIMDLPSIFFPRSHRIQLFLGNLRRDRSYHFPTKRWEFLAVSDRLYLAVSWIPEAMSLKKIKQSFSYSGISQSIVASYRTNALCILRYHIIIMIPDYWQSKTFLNDQRTLIIIQLCASLGKFLRAGHIKKDPVDTMY